MIKAFYLGYLQAGAHVNASVFIKDDTDVDTGCISVPLTISTSDTNASVYAAIPGAVNTFCSTNFSFTPDAGEWLYEPSTAAPTRSETTLSLTVQTSTGAVGTQVSSTNDALVFVNSNISTTANISGSAADDLVVEVAPTNSGTAGDWIEKARSGNSQAVSLAVVLQSVQNNKGEMVVYVPKGYYIKVRSTGSSGTFSNGISSTRAVLF